LRGPMGSSSSLGIMQVSCKTQLLKELRVVVVHSERVANWSLDLNALRLRPSPSTSSKQANS